MSVNTENNDALTDEEREAVAELEAEGAQAQPAAEEDDRPWLEEARASRAELLTDEELRALSDEDDEDEGGEEDDGGAGPDDDATQDDADIEAQQLDDTPPAAQEPQRPASQAPAPEEVKLTAEETKAIDAKIADALDKLDDQYDDGELTREELKAERARVLESRGAEVDTALAAKRDAAEEARNEAFATSHVAAAKVFLAKNPGLRSNDAVMARFDQLQKQVQVDPAFASTDSMAIFEEAKARLVDEANRQKKTIPGVTNPPKRPSHATRQIPPSMSDIPAAADNTPQMSRLAAMAKRIDSADTLEAERLMSTLSPEEQDAVLEGRY